MRLNPLLLVALAAWQAARIPSVRDDLLFGLFGNTKVEALEEPAAAERWAVVNERAARAKSRLRQPPTASREIGMVWEKRRQYERLFNAVGVSLVASDDSDVWIAEEAADLVGGMRPCYEWEGFSDCPLREAEFAVFWMGHQPRSAFIAFLPLFAGQRLLCAAEGFDYEEAPTKAAEARRRARLLLEQAAAGRDALFSYVAKQILAEPRCLVSRY